MGQRPFNSGAPGGHGQSHGWFEGLNERGKIKAAQPLGGQGRILSGGNGNLVVDGPFAESKEAVGGYLVLQADNMNDAVDIARSTPMLKYGITVEVRPLLAECPIFQRHRTLLERARDRAVRAANFGRDRRVMEGSLKRKLKERNFI